MSVIETLQKKREEMVSHPAADGQKNALHIQRAAAAGQLAAALLPLRAAYSAVAVAEAYEDAYNIMFPAKSAPAYVAWAEAKGITIK